MKHIVLQPKLSLEEADTRYERQYVRDPGVYIEEDSIGRLETGELKFLFLRNRLPSANHYLYDELRTLRFKPANVSRRRALHGSAGGELMMGWFKDHINGGGKSRPAVSNDPYPIVYDRLTLIAVHMAETMEEYVPDLWRQQVILAKRNKKKLIGGQILDILPRHLMSDDEWPLFSTVAINRNTTFLAHTDDKNERGFACMVTFGRFVGGGLCFPRLGISFDVQPGDLLIADTNRELHGTVRNRSGDRISVVAYLRELK